MLDGGKFHHDMENIDCEPIFFYFATLSNFPQFNQQFTFTKQILFKMAKSLNAENFIV